MDGVILRETLRRKWKQVLYWGGGLALYAIFTFLLIPDLEALQGYVELLEEMPEMMNIIGLNDAAVMATPEGFVGVEFFSFLLVITGVYGVVAGMNVTANDENSGAIDLLLSLPLPRWRIVVEKALAYTVIILGISLLTFIGLTIGRALAPQPVDMTVLDLLGAALNFAPGTLFIMTITTLINVVVRRRALGLALSGGFVVLSFLVNIVASAANNNTADLIAELSVFKHYAGATILTDGMALSNVTLVSIAAALCVMISVARFERRDLAV